MKHHQHNSTEWPKISENTVIYDDDSVIKTLIIYTVDDFT